MAKAIEILKEPSIAKVVKRAKAVKQTNAKTIKKASSQKQGASKGSIIKETSVTANVEGFALNHAIGKAIAKYRKQANLSQEQLAEALGIGYEAVSRMERGVVIPTVDRLIEIAEVVDCPVTEFLSQSSPRPTDEVVHLYQLLSSLSSENKQWLMEQIELWVSKLK